MDPEPLELLAIAGMALATYATRAGGLWLVSRLRLGERTAAGLRALPGALLTAIVAPAVLGSGPVGLAAALVTVAVARRTGSPLAAMVVGVALVVAGRALLPS